MSTRYYLSQFILVPGLRGRLVWKPSLSSYPLTAYSCLFKSNASGVGGFGLVVVEAADHTPLLADTDSTALPALNLTDTPTGAHVAAVQAALTRFGLSTALPQTNSFGNLLRTVGQHFIGSFDENQFAGTVR